MPTDLKVTPEAFSAEVSQHKDKNVIVDFWAPWCGPCRMVSPVLDEIEAENDNVILLKINVDENPEMAQKFRIMSIPTIMFFKNGQKNAPPIIGVASKELILSNLT